MVEIIHIKELENGSRKKLSKHVIIIGLNLRSKALQFDYRTFSAE